VNSPYTNTGVFVAIVACLILTGCQGTGTTLNFDPHALSANPTQTITAHADDLIIVVEPFQDARPQHTRLGVRTHLWGGVTHFNVWNGNISEGMANMAIEYLQQQHWQASRGMKTQAQKDGLSDVILTGTILSLKANAKSGFGFTDITVDMRVRFEAKNTKDGSSVRMVLGANGSDSVTYFALKDVERLFNLVAKDLYKQLFRDLVGKDKAFHLQSQARS